MNRIVKMDRSLFKSLNLFCNHLLKLKTQFKCHFSKCSKLFFKHKCPKNQQLFLKEQEKKNFLLCKFKNTVRRM